jgi:hypothetical protein
MDSRSLFNDYRRRLPMLDKQTVNNLKNYKAFIGITGGPEECTGYRPGQSMNIKNRINDITRIVAENRKMFSRLSNVRSSVDSYAELKAQA